MELREIVSVPFPFLSSPPLTFVGDLFEEVGDDVVEGGAAAGADHRV